MGQLHMATFIAVNGYSPRKFVDNRKIARSHARNSQK